jgi:hypothetical protein
VGGRGTSNQNLLDSEPLGFMILLIAPFHFFSESGVGHLQGPYWQRQPGLTGSSKYIF